MKLVPIKPVDDWRDAWRFASIRTTLLGIGFQVICVALLKGITVAVAFLGYVDLVWIPVIAIAISLVAIAGRVSKQKLKPRK